MDENRPILGVIVQDPRIREFLVQRLDGLEYAFDHVVCQSVEELHRDHGGRYFFALVSDVRAMIKASSLERAAIQNIEGSLPVFKVNLDAGGDTLAGMGMGRNYPDFDSLLEEFLQLASSGRMRGIRSARRSRLFLSVSVTDPTGGRAFRACTADVSSGGAFLIQFEPVLRGHRFGVKIHDLQDQTPIEVEVCWVLPWGESRSHAPGCGLRFVSITEAQESQITTLASSGPAEDGAIWF